MHQPCALARAFAGKASQRDQAIKRNAGTNTKTLIDFLSVLMIIEVKS